MSRRASLLFPLLAALLAAPLPAAAQDAAQDGEPSTDADAPVAAPVSEDPADGSAASPTEDDPAELGAALRQREEVRPWHIAFGTATGISSYATTILGFLTFNDRYGWDGDPASTGCASGSPIFGDDACTGPPIGHVIAAATTTAVFTATFVLALFMPDPLHVDEGPGERATLLTVHKSLRWALLVLYVGQVVLGAITSAVDTDFGTQRALASVHLALGTVTMATMTTQGVLGSILEW
jgi:hypothetical protein